MPAANTVVDFWKKVDRKGPEECWLWRSCFYGNKWKYGFFALSGTRWAAHRFSWTITNGPIPDGLFVLHKCDVTLCVNPAHLFIGTHEDNMRDMYSKRRQADPLQLAEIQRQINHKGSANAVSKLTEAQVVEMRQRVASGDITQKEATQIYGVTKGLVSMIINRKIWTHC